MRPQNIIAAVAAMAVAAAASAATLTGQVVSAGGDPVPDAVVSLVDLRLENRTDADGRFHFEDLPEGELLVEVSSPRFGGSVQRVFVREGGPIDVTFELDQLVHSDRITVTATGVASSLSEVVAPVDVLSGTELILRREATLGETLARQPGVSSTSYGQGSSRPVIRGLGSDRIRILENGLDTGDVSSLGPDHAVSSDPLAAERVEVVRGPGTLLYGSNALGGVVNILDGRVPDRSATAPVTGTVQLEYGSNADRLAGAAKLDGGSGTMAWHLDLYARDQGDYSSPAPRLAAEEHDDGEPGGDHWDDAEAGTVQNSYASAQGATLGASYVANRGYIGIAVSGLDNEYGIPSHGHHHDESPLLAKILEGEDGNEEHDVHTELEQRRVDVHGRLDRPFGGLAAVRLSVGWRDYNHQEIEGDRVGTRFENTWTEARLEGLHERLVGFTGTIGLHWIEREFAAFGEEAFVEPTDTTKMAVFLFEQSEPEPIGFQFGMRLENQDTTTSDPELPNRDFVTFSASAGLVMDLSDAWSTTVSLSRSERPPTSEELYSDGPHAATFAYEIGDPALTSEVGMGVDLAIRADYDWFEAALSAFATQYDSFIYLRDTDVEEDGLSVMRFSQDDADFYGFELHGHVEVLHGPNSHLHVGFSYDQVRASLRATGEPLPRIPPRSALLALVYLAQRWDARVEGRWVDNQIRVAANEDPTPSSTMYDASLSYKIFSGPVLHELLLKGTNLTDEAAYNHVSFLKFQAPIPGRSIALVYRFLF